MISIRVEGKPLQFGRYEVEVPCPRCRLHVWLRFDQVLHHDILVCRGCHANIVPDDHLGGLRRSVRMLDNAFNSLLRSFR